MTELPGLKAHHSLITPSCIAQHGEEGAIDEALRRLRAEMVERVKGCRGVPATFHAVLTVDRHKVDDL